MIESNFDHLERMLYLGTQLHLGVFDFSLYPKQHAVFAVMPVAAGPCCNRPNNIPFSMLRSLGRTGVSDISRDIDFGTVQQLVDLGDIGHVGRRLHQAVHQPRRGVDANLGLYLEVPLIAFFSLMCCR
jgi:hypothetical protein